MFNFEGFVHNVNGENMGIVMDENWLAYSNLSRFNIQRYISQKDGSDVVTGFKKVNPLRIRPGTPRAGVRLHLTHSKVGVSFSLLEPYQTGPVNSNNFSIRGIRGRC